MVLADERPENELHEQRASELITLIALVLQDAGSEAKSGAIACPVCKHGRVSYAVTATDGARAIAAQCSSVGCISFRSSGRS